MASGRVQGASSDTKRGRESAARSAPASGGTIVFLGPSLPAAEARALLPEAELHPPVAVLDVLRLLHVRRRALPARLAIIDGYFERMAAVWHKELLLALEHGVEVWGAASMGALRAAELHPFGMRGVGAIFDGFASGRLTADAEVAVAHLPGEWDYQAMSVALVDVRDALTRARRARVIEARVASSLLAAATATFYADRTWEALAAPLPARVRARFTAWLAEARPSRKADDARLLLRTLADTPPAPPPARGIAVPRTWAFAHALRLARRPPAA
jgi:hypothetical protein